MHKWNLISTSNGMNK